MRIEEQLREQMALARLGEMAAVIAHEVKNPLAGVRGAITRVSIEAINVPQPLSRLFNDQLSYTPWTYDGRELKILPPTYAVAVRVGSLYEPWVTNAKPLR